MLETNPAEQQAKLTALTALRDAAAAGGADAVLVNA